MLMWCASAFAASLCVALTATADPPVFGGEVFFGPTAPEFIQAIDLNDDGALDLIVVGEAEIHILLGDGAGRFALHQIIMGGDAQLAVADVDQDGLDDLIVGAFTGCALHLHRGVGAGLFAPAEKLPSGCGPAGVVAADLNDDGIPDIAAANFESQTVSVLLGLGAGNFKLSESISTPLSPGVGSLAVADMDNDGDLDLITVGGASMTIHRNDGDGAFPSRTSYPAGPGPRSVQVGNLNTDALLDVVVANEVANSLSVIRQFAPNMFLPPQTISVGARPERIILADLDGDGDLDVAITHPSTNFEFENPEEPEGQIGLYGGEVRILRNNGGGALLPSDRFFAGAWPRAMAVGDLNGDNAPDIAVASRAQTSLFTPFLTEGAADDSRDFVAIAFGIGDAKFGAPDRVLSIGASRVQLVDIDVDGDPDLVEGRNFGFLIRRNAGDGEFETLVGGINTSGLPQENQSFAFGLIDDDNNPDLVAATSEGVKVAFGNGAGFFSPFTTVATGVFRSVALIDFNNDNRADIIAGEIRDNEADALVLLRGNGFGGFTRIGMERVGEEPSTLALAHLNGDAIPDVAVGARADASVTMVALFPQGDTTVIATVPVPGSVASVRAGDIDNDHDVDFVIAMTTSNHSLAVLRNNGAGAFEYIPIDGGFTAPDAALADFNFDGHPDILVADADNDRLRLYLNNTGSGAPGEFTLISNIVSGDFPRSLAVADIDGDDRLDVVVAAKPSASNGTPAFFNAVLAYHNIALGRKRIGDLTGEGAVGAADLAILLQQWGPCQPKEPCPADLNNDGAVNGADLATLLANWS